MSRVQWVLVNLALLAVCRSAASQGVLQQPAVETFGVDTSVSVPDRGSAFLGGVSRSRSGSSTYGPTHWNRAYGFEHRFSSVDVSVFLHDFEAMDEALLAAPTSEQPPGGRDTARITEPQARPSTRAQAAWRAMQSRR